MDTLKEVLKNFPKQFGWEPKIENQNNLVRKSIFVVAGMGGSHLAANILQSYNHSLDVIVYSDYGLELPPGVLEESLVIASSYSGNTKETLDVFNTALAKNLPVAAIASGGELLKLAQEKRIPYIQIPDTGIEPRFALGFSLRALLKLLDQKTALAETAELARLLDSGACELKGRELVQKLENKIPVIYSSAKNFSLAYTWKIKLNETTKIPAFCNICPELNHNEINGFDTHEKTGELTKRFHFILLRDKTDHPKVQEGMSVLKTLLERQEFKVEVVPLDGESFWHKAFNSLLTADWASYFLSEFYGTEPEATPLTEEFKKMAN